jgi:uncharacterized protein (DUF433 family)
MAGEQQANNQPEWIIQDLTSLGGKPVVTGTRIPVALVVAKLAANPDVQELFADYPQLTIDGVKACLAYAARLVEQQRIASRRRMRAGMTTDTAAVPLTVDQVCGAVPTPPHLKGKSVEEISNLAKEDYIDHISRERWQCVLSRGREFDLTI